MSQVVNKFLAQVPANTLKGNNTSSTANPTDLTVAQVNAILPVFTSTLNGLAPLSGGGTTNFLRADGTWAAPSGGGSGTVTSVALVDSTGLFTVSGSPITTSGSLTLNYSGTALPITNGGTGQTTAAAAFNALNPMTTTGDLIYEASAGVSSRLPIGSTGQILTVSGGVPTWSNANGIASVASYVSVNTQNGQGSTNSGVLRWSNSTVVGSDITYTDSATLGATFTINATGTYALSGNIQQNAAYASAFTRNSTQLNVDPNTILDGTLLALNPGNASFLGLAYTVALNAGDVIRVQVNPSNTTGTDVQQIFTIIRVNAPLLTNINNIRTVTTSSTLSVTDNYILVNGTGAVTLTLPTASAGQTYNIKNISSFTTTITPTSGTIDGSSSATLPVKYGAIELIFDGTNWWVY